MEGTCTDGGVTGGGRPYGAFLNEFKLRNTSSVAHTPGKIGFQSFRSGMENGVSDADASAASRNVPLVPVCEELLPD